MNSLWLILLTVPIAVVGYIVLTKKQEPESTYTYPPTLADSIREKVAEAQKKADQ
ncbi:MAG: hypothetical protein JST01_10830 [Cyanobacteria bacterium SZAS TMP-1]|nr:hypothetical protein [Cyanobacteria bacterium SZAS TMP-1]